MLYLNRDDSPKTFLRTYAGCWLYLSLTVFTKAVTPFLDVVMCISELPLSATTSTGQVCPGKVRNLSKDSKYWAHGSVVLD